MPQNGVRAVAPPRQSLGRKSAVPPPSNRNDPPPAVLTLFPLDIPFPLWEPRRVRIISRKRLRDFAEIHPDAETSLNHWCHVARRVEWKNLAEVRLLFPHADLTDDGRLVFNIGGNKYRLIVFIHYRFQIIYIKDVLTHADYDRKN